MIEEISKIKESFNEVNKKISLKNFCFDNLFLCCLEIILIGIIFLNKMIGLNGLIILLIFFSTLIIVYFHFKKFREKLFKNEDINPIKEYSDFWLDFKYQILKNKLKEKLSISDLNVIQCKLDDYIKILEEEYLSKQNLIEKNPIFSISFAIFIAILGSGVLNKGKDLDFLASFFLLSIMGIMISLIIHPLFSFNKEKQLIFLLKLLKYELNQNKGMKNEKSIWSYRN